MKMSWCDLLCDRGRLQLTIIVLPSKMTAVFSTATKDYPQTRIIVIVAAAKIPMKVLRLFLCVPVEISSAMAHGFLALSVFSSLTL